MKEQQVAELEVDLCLNTEWDEFWSYVEGKKIKDGRGIL